MTESDADNKKKNNCNGDGDGDGRLAERRGDGWSSSEANSATDTAKARKLTYICYERQQ
jgi:hypothetical protein